MLKKSFIFLTCLLICSACTTLKKNSSQDADQSQHNSSSSYRASADESKETNNIYYDFDDILVPKEMKLRPDDSLLFETPTVKAGVILFEGRVEPVSLFNFFINNMPKDNWQLRSYFKYGRYIMVYEKPDRDCVISLNERSLTTQLQIWVTPRTKSKGTQEQIMGTGSRDLDH